MWINLALVDPVGTLMKPEPGFAEMGDHGF